MTKDIHLLDPSKISSIENYASALLIGMHQIISLDNTHVEAMKNGLLTPVEQEIAESAVWELRRTIKIYRNLLDKILEKTPLTENEIVESLNKMMKKSKKK